MAHSSLAKKINCRQAPKYSISNQGNPFLRPDKFSHSTLDQSFTNAFSTTFVTNRCLKIISTERMLIGAIIGTIFDFNDIFTLSFLARMLRTRPWPGGRPAHFDGQIHTPGLIWVCLCLLRVHAHVDKAQVGLGLHCCVLSETDDLLFLLSIEYIVVSMNGSLRKRPPTLTE